MHFDFIEIGTSDFDTLLQSAIPGTRGLSIEPLKLYLDNLPEVDGVTKLNCAITDHDGEISIYWVDPASITEHNLPDWVRGCNSVNRPHPTVENLLSSLGILSIYQVSKCPCLTWDTLVKNHQVKSVDLLKIDTEGHDGIILNMIADSQLTIFPKKIIFEKNVLSNHRLIEQAVLKFKSFGYKITSEDTSINQVLEL